MVFPLTAFPFSYCNGFMHFPLFFRCILCSAWMSDRLTKVKYFIYHPWSSEMNRKSKPCEKGRVDYQEVMWLGVVHGNIGAEVTDVHQLGKHIGGTLSEKQHRESVLFASYPGRQWGENQSRYDSKGCTRGESLQASIKTSPPNMWISVCEWRQRWVSSFLTASNLSTWLCGPKSPILLEPRLYLLTLDSMITQTNIQRLKLVYSHLRYFTGC